MLEVKEASVPYLCEFDLLLFHLFEIYWPSDLDHEAAKPWRSSKAKILKDLGDQFGVQVEVADYRNSWWYKRIGIISSGASNQERKRRV